MKVLTIAGSGLRQLMRDRTTVFFTVLLPFLIIFVVGTATADLGDEVFPVGIVDRGSGELGAELRSAIDRSKTIELTSYDDEDEMRRALRRGVVIAGVVIPRGYDDALSEGRRVELGFLADVTRGFPAFIRASISSAAADQGAVLQAARFATSKTDRSFEANLVEARRVSGLVREVGIERDELGDRPRNRTIMAGFDYTAPSNLVLFVFITSIAGASQLIASRRLGISRRMLATPTTTRTVILGETLGRFAIAVFQALYIVVLGLVVFGVDWGDPVAAIVLIVLFALVGTSFAMLIGSWARTPEQAGTIGPAVGIAMGMLAGCMWPRFIMPIPMQRIGQLFPHAWAMDAFIKLVAQRGTIVDILPQLGILAAFVVVLLPLSAFLLRRSIQHA